MATDVGAQQAFRLLQEALRRKHAEEVPPGWKTMKQWAKEAGIGKTMAVVTIRAALDEDLMESREFLVMNQGKLIKMPHYKLKNEGSAKEKR